MDLSVCIYPTPELLSFGRYKARTQSHNKLSYIWSELSWALKERFYGHWGIPLRACGQVHSQDCDWLLAQEWAYWCLNILACFSTGARSGTTGLVSIIIIIVILHIGAVTSTTTEQDATQGQSLSKVQVVWIQIFPSLRLAALPRLKNSVCPSSYQ